MLSYLPGRRWWGVAILALAALTDRLDGDLARKFGQITEWGKILDPLADKIGVAAVASVLLYLGTIPAWFLAVILLRDLLIFAGGMYLKSSRGLVLPSNQAGKWAVGIVTLTLFAALVEAGSPWMAILLAASCALLLLSFVQYIGRFAAVVRSPGAP
jgi:CDP-diacylglycerol--glycerol-3-phosphate 3-phosphatidyltransferase